MNLQTRVRCSFLLLSLLAGLAASPAFAHAMLIGSTPVEGDVIKTSPARFVLGFREAVSGLLFRLVSPGNVVSDLSGAGLNGDTLTIDLPPRLRSGTHLLVWRVVGRDGHPMGGVVTFSVGAPSETPTLPDFRAYGLSSGIWVGRLLLYAALLIGVGGAVFRAWLVDMEPLPAFATRAILVSLVSVFVMSAANVALQGLDSFDASWTALAGAEVWRAGMTGTFGHAIGLACLASGIALAGSWMRRLTLRRVASLLALLLSGAGIAATGHSGAGAGMSLAWLALFIHAVCLTIWIGALVPLAALLHTNPGKRGKVLLRFSAIIPIPLALIVLTGVALSALRLGSLFNLLATDYGLVLIAKVSLVLALLALASYNRFQLTPRFVSAPAETSRAFSGSICLELLIVGAVLGVVGLWRFIPPPVDAAQAERPTVAYIKGADVSAFVTITPVSGSARSLTINLMDRDSRPLKAEQVWMTVSYVTFAAAPVRRLATQIGEGTYRVDGVVMPNPGLWKFQIDIMSGSMHAQLEQQLLLGGRPLARLVNSDTSGVQPMKGMQGM